MKDDDIDSVCEEFSKLHPWFSKFIANQIYFITEIRPLEHEKYAELYSRLYQIESFSQNLKEKALKNLHLPFARHLFERNVITLDEIIADNDINDVFADVIPGYYDYLITEPQKISNYLVTKDWVYDGYHKNTIEHAIKFDDIEKFIEFYANADFDITKFACKGRFENYPSIIQGFFDYITFAAYYGSVNVFKFLIGNGMKPTQYTLRYAMSSGSAELVRLCLQNGTEMTFQDAKISAAYHRYDIMEWAKSNYDYQFIDCYNLETLLYITDKRIMQALLCDLIDLQYYDFARLYILRNCEINFCRNLETPLSIAVKGNDYKFVEFLLEKGAVCHLASDDRPRYAVFQCSSFKMFSLLKKHWFDPKAEFADRQSAFSQLIAYCDEKTIDFMIEQKIKPIQNDLRFAIAKGNLKLVKYFVEEWKLKLGVDSLRLAYTRGCADIVNYILSQGVTPVTPFCVPKKSMKSIREICEKHGIEFIFGPNEVNRYCIKIMHDQFPDFKLSQHTFCQNFDDLISYYENGDFTCQNILGYEYEMISSLRRAFIKD